MNEINDPAIHADHEHRLLELWRALVRMQPELRQPAEQHRDWLTKEGLLAWPQFVASHGELPAKTLYRAWWDVSASAASRRRKSRQAVAERLEEAGIPYAWLKGAAWAEKLYGDSVLRDMVDLDLWVPPQWQPQLAGVLAPLGYLPQSLSVPTDNFEWTFVSESPAFLPLDVHFELVPSWRIPWSPVPPVQPGENYLDEDLLAAHAIAHFAQHKGVVRRIQEFDLVLWSLRGRPQVLPEPLKPAAGLWRLRAEGVWFGSAPHAGVRRHVLRMLYRGAAVHPVGRGLGAWIRERLLGLALASRPLGWFQQLWRRLRGNGND